MEQINVGDWVCWRNYLTKKIAGCCQVTTPKKGNSPENYAVTNSSDGKDGAVTKAGAIKCAVLPSGHLVRPFVLDEALAGVGLVTGSGGLCGVFTQAEPLASQYPFCCNGNEYAATGRYYFSWISSDGDGPYDLFILVATPEELTKLKGESHGGTTPVSVVTTEGRDSVTNAQSTGPQDKAIYQSIADGYFAATANAAMVARDEPKPTVQQLLQNGPIAPQITFEQSGKIACFTTYLDYSSRHGKLDPASVLVDWSEG